MCLPCMFLRTEANSHHTYDVTIWLSRTTDNSNIFIRSREVRDNESRLYMELSQGKILQKRKTQELSSLFMTHRLNVMHAPVKFHEYIPYGLGVMARTRLTIWN